MNQPEADPWAQRSSPLKKSLLLAAVVLPFVATLWAIHLVWNRYVTWFDVGLLAGMFLLTSTGIGVGYHRMLTHRSFEAPEPVRFVFLAMGSMALQGQAIEWAATHTKHHALSDRDGDPHSPVKSFFDGHMGWLFRDRFVRGGVWGKAFENDATATFIDRTFYIWTILGFAVPGVIGLLHGGGHGFWLALLWGGLVRVFLGHHVTWSVNSVCHTFGRREFQSHDRSSNQWVVGLLALGEGWHNNHHAFPKAAYHGMRWWQFDFNAILIRTMAALGLATRVWNPDPTEIEARRIPRAQRSMRTVRRGGGWRTPQAQTKDEAGGETRSQLPRPLPELRAR